MMKKLSAILLALVMVLSMTATAFAANVTLPTGEVLKNHSFTAYQVFKGDWSAEDNTVGVLSNVTEGDGVDFDDFLAALQANAEFGSKFTACKTAEDVAKVLSGTANDSALAKAVAEIAYANIVEAAGIALSAGENTLDDGYYLVVDSTENVADGSAYNKALLQVVGDITIGVKTDAPTLEKKVQEDNKTVGDNTYGEGYNDVADYDIGEAVPFILVASVPNMAEYDTYKYIFHDTLSAGLTVPSSVVVYLSSDKKVDDADTEISDDAYDFAANGQSFTVSFENLKTVVGTSGAKYVIVAYTAVLNAGAEIGLPGNPNTAYLEYSNNPNHSGEGDNDNTGKTPDDKVIVFTYELDTTKIDGATAEAEDPTELADAEFVLYKVENSVNKYAIVDANGKITGWAEATTGADGKVAYPANSTLKSDADGLFKVIGLDDGTYYLKETKAPVGYNLLKEDITVVITATTTNNDEWTSSDPAAALTNLAVTADGKAGAADKNTGIASITVANNKGTTLPETGGVGTTILYAVGGLLVLGAAVLLITKKRMENN